MTAANNVEQAGCAALIGFDQASIAHIGALALANQLCQLFTALQ